MRSLQVLKLVVVLLIGILILSACSVSPSNVENEEELNDTNINKNNYDSILALLDNKIEEEKIDMEKLSVTKLDDQYSLVQLKTKDTLKGGAGKYFLIDYKKDKIEEIDLIDNLSQAKDITYQNKQITFIFDGSNPINSHKEFPYKVIYNIESKKSLKKKIYKEITYNHKIGNSINELKLDGVIVDN